MKENIDKFKLKSEEHTDFDKRIQDLADGNFESNFHINFDYDIEKEVDEEDIGKEPGE